MGINKTIQQMKPKRRKLILDLTAVGIIFTLVFGALDAMKSYADGGGYMSFFSNASLVYIIMILLFLFMARKFIEKAMEEPQKSNKPKPKPQQPTKIPIKPYITAQKPRQTKGSIICPKCNTLVLSPVCSNCGWRR
jgi:hypothetical protein